MTWAAFPWSALVAIGALMWAVALLAMDERNRRKFITREELSGLRERLERDVEGVRRTTLRNETLFVALDDRVGDLEGAVGRIEERQTQQWERVAEQMATTARTIDDVTRRLERMSEAQQEHALRLERMQRTNP